MIAALSLATVETFKNQIVHCDALTLLRSMPENSVDLIVTDPPYYKVKNSHWDRQWDTPAAFLEFVGQLCDGWHRVLKPNGSLYVFASPAMASRVELEIGKRFNVLNNIRWVKQNGWHRKADGEALRAYLSPWEAVVFAEHYNADNAAKGESGYWLELDKLRGFVFEPLRAYLAGEFDRAGVKYAKANDYCGTASIAARHYFARSQWCLPTKEHYERLRKGLNAETGGDYLRREYEDLRREYEDLRREYEDLRRPFNSYSGQFFPDIWTFPSVPPGNGRHEAEKPLSMAKFIISMSSRRGGVVLDTFCGSGVFLDAARQLNRDFIGCDFSAYWVRRSQARVKRPFSVPLPLFASGETMEDPRKNIKQLSLFGNGNGHNHAG